MHLRATLPSSWAPFYWTTPLQGDIYSMHYSAEHWRDPAAFLPERFLPGAPQAEGCNPDAWLPFGEVSLPHRLAGGLIMRALCAAAACSR